MGIMIKHIVTIALLAYVAQAASWTNHAIAAFNLSQNSHHNWTAGGEDAIVWQASLQAGSEAAFTSWNWNNTIDLAYGRTQIDDQASRKHLDKLFFESLVNYNLRTTLKPYVAGRAESQFTKSYVYSDTAARVAISNFWDPGYLTESVGLSYIPNTIFQTRLGFALKQTFSEEYAWADDPETLDKIETFKNEPGLESISEVNLPWNEIVVFKSRLSAFVNFKGTEEIDGRWENTLNAQVSKYLVFSAGLEMLYDKDLSVDSQLRQSLTIGLTYQLI